MTVYLALDLETVLDVELGRKVLVPADMPADMVATDKQVRNFMRLAEKERTNGKSDFLKPIYHRICAVGLAYYDTQLGKTDSIAHAGREEPELIKAALNALRKGPALITFNGRSFDLPVLKQRAYGWGIPFGALTGSPNQKPWDKYDFRYGGPHLDVADALTTYGASTMPNMAECLALCDLEPKITSGAAVEGMFEEEAWDQMMDYVRDDAEKTLQLGLRWERLRGRLQTDIDLDLFHQPEDGDETAA